MLFNPMTEKNSYAIIAPVFAVAAVACLAEERNRRFGWLFVFALVSIGIFPELFWRVDKGFGLWWDPLVAAVAGGDPRVRDRHAPAGPCRGRDGMKCLEVAPDGAGYRAKVAEVERPLPRAGEVLVRVAASGLNRADLDQIAGHYPPPAGEPEILGLELSGTVVETGEQVCALVAGGRPRGVRRRSGGPGRSRRRTGSRSPTPPRFPRPS